MPIVTATAADLAAVKAFVRAAARSQVGVGEEDLAMLLEAGNVLLKVAEPSQPAGRPHQAPLLGQALPRRREEMEAAAVFYPEPRPISLPAEEPDRVFLRGAAFRSGVSPSAALGELIGAWCEERAGGARLLIAYGGEPWYNRALAAAQCERAEEVIFYALPHIDCEGPELRLGVGESQAIELRAATPADLRDLALLDAACFDVLWHMGPADLRQLLLFGRLTVAVMEGRLAGYMALTMRDDVCQVARLAVHPADGGHGIGRRLLVEGLRAAAEAGCRRAVLNTQANNVRAQALYRSLGFHPTGERFEVYTRAAAGTA
jgi:ribosomal-protein-alanine N-acetyltransferase